MRRGIAIVLLAAGTVLGFGWGFARLSGHCGYGWHGAGFHGHGAWDDRGRALEDRAADACVRAAERVLNERKGAPAPANPSAEHAPNP